MILIDYSQVVISNLIEAVDYDEKFARHLIINSLRNYISKFKEKYGPEVVIACDSRHYWRKAIFPYYKAHRKKNREDGGKDWETLFRCMGIVKEELKEYFPHKVLEVDFCEADDIIATLVRAAPYQKTMIISSDKDFAQLHVFPNIKQFSPIQKKFVKTADPKAYLKEHIIRGDKGDGIPNILSPDDIFVTEGRQKSIMQKNLDIWLTQEYEEAFSGDTLKKYKRNQTLIDFRMIPKEHVDNILDIYKNKSKCSRNDFLNYMIENRLSKLIVTIGDF